MHGVCAPVCSGVLWCVFDTTHIYWVQHWYCCNAAPSFSEHTYDIPLRDALWAIFWVRGTLCCTLNGCMHSIGRLPPYWDITKSPVGGSTALTPIGRSFEIGRSNLGALYRPPDCCTFTFALRTTATFHTNLTSHDYQKVPSYNKPSKGGELQQQGSRTSCSWSWP